MNLKTTFIAILSIPLSALACRADNTSVNGGDIFAMSLEDALEIPVQVASKGLKQTIRTAPGSIVVLDAETIRDSGARDLMELLELVPGFQFTIDNNSATVLGFRGLGNTGRFLLRIDGQEMPENVFNTLQLAGHYSTANIDRVEIIRGPGSVLYGGSAEYAVIEVTTKHADDHHSGQVTVNYGQTNEGPSRVAGLASIGVAKGSDFLNVAIEGGRGVRGSGNFTDFFGNSYRMEDDAEYFPRMVNVGGEWKDLSFRYIGDRYGYEDRDLFFANAPYALLEHNFQQRAELKYAPKLSDSLSAVVHVNYGIDRPFHATDQATRDLEALNPGFFGGAFSNSRTQQTSATTEFTYTPSDVYSVLLGAEGKYLEGDGTYIAGGTEELPLQAFYSKNAAVYAQLTANPGFATMTAGSRYEYNNHYYGSLVSRLSLTKAEKNWHAKGQFAQAFRSPGYFNSTLFFDPSDEQNHIEPERTNVTEFEFGHSVTNNLYFTTTLFDTKTTDAITFFIDPNVGLAYGNLGDTGSRGVEANFRYVTSLADLSLAYAYYRPHGNELEGSMVVAPQHTDPRAYPGFSPHVVTLLATYHFSSDITANTSLQLRGRKYATTSANEDFVLVNEHLPTEQVWNANLAWRNIGWDNFDVQLGMRNILDEKVQYAPPGNAFHSPMPGLGREAFVNATLHW